MTKSEKRVKVSEKLVWIHDYAKANPDKDGKQIEAALKAHFGEGVDHSLAYATIRNARGLGNSRVKKAPRRSPKAEKGTISQATHQAIHALAAAMKKDDLTSITLNLTKGKLVNVKYTQQVLTIKTVSGVTRF